MSAGIIILLLLALLLVVFTLQNSVAIDVHVLFWQLNEVPLVLTLLICVLIGFIAAVIIDYPKVWRLKSTIKSLHKELQQLKEAKTEVEKHPEGTPMTGGKDNDFFDA
ncbi:MAG: lipopolysaccharide assembly LapA domain-containing protein [Mangrovibacterium sp.]